MSQWRHMPSLAPDRRPDIRPAVGGGLLFRTGSDAKQALTSSPKADPMPAAGVEARLSGKQLHGPGEFVREVEGALLSQSARQHGRVALAVSANPEREAARHLPPRHPAPDQR